VILRVLNVGESEGVVASVGDKTRAICQEFGMVSSLSVETHRLLVFLGLSVPEVDITVLAEGGDLIATWDRHNGGNLLAIVSIPGLDWGKVAVDDVDVTLLVSEPKCTGLADIRHGLNLWGLLKLSGCSSAKLSSINSLHVAVAEVCVDVAITSCHKERCAFQLTLLHLWIALNLNHFLVEGASEEASAARSEASNILFVGQTLNLGGLELPISLIDKLSWAVVEAITLPLNIEDGFSTRVNVLQPLTIFRRDKHSFASDSESVLGSIYSSNSHADISSKGIELLGASTLANLMDQSEGISSVVELPGLDLVVKGASGHVW
jgi:hypothetical protein